MPPIALKVNVAVTLPAPTIDVAPLPPGQHKIQLVVINENNVSSLPVTAIVTVAQG
jgi:hypothetical protein